MKRCLDSGIKSVTWNYNTLTDSYATVNVVFGNGIKGCLWNENFPYAWMSNSTYSTTGRTDTFNKSMPDLKQRARMYYELSKYPKPRIDEASCILQSL